MSTVSPRFIVVDDLDTSIQYTGPWYLDQGSQDSAGEAPYLVTLHGAKANASLAFLFSGTRIKLFGTFNLSNISGVLDPTWECFVDNISIGGNPSLTVPVENNGLFCDYERLLDGPHVLTVNATILKKQTFWVNDIQYVPSASVSLDQAAIRVDNFDPQLQYGEGWNYSVIGDRMTAVHGSIFTYDFIGVSVTWYGSLEMGLSPSPVSYSIDGQTPIGFTLEGTELTVNKVFFQTAQLTAGPHTLKVVYEGGSNSTPLTLEYLIVQNGTLSSTTSVSSHNVTSIMPSDYPTPSGTTLPRGKSSTPTGAIAGGVIGGLAFIILALLGFLLLRRRQGNSAQKKYSLSVPTPFDYTLHPSIATASGGMKGQVYHVSMPGPTSTDVSRSIEPLGNSSGVVSYPTNLNPVPLQQAALALANSSSSPPALVSSAPSPLPNRTGREAKILAPLRLQRQGNPSVPVSVPNNDIRSPNVVLHADSGLRMPLATASASVVDVPPIYTPD